MDLSQARLLLATGNDRLGVIAQELDAIKTMRETFDKVWSQRVNTVEGLMRDNSRDLALLAGSGINPDDIVSLRNMYAVALENMDRVRITGTFLRASIDHERNVRANLAVIKETIRRNTR